MSANPLDAMLDDVMALPAEERLAGALAVFRREHARLLAEYNHIAWSKGLRGEGVATIPGLSETLTGLVRRLAACGVVRHADMDELPRNISALRKWLARHAPAVSIATLKDEGYEVVAGFDDLYRLLHGQAATQAGQRRRAHGFSTHQSVILFHIAQHGSAHVDQFPNLPRHMSNIRAVVAELGLDRKIVFETRTGEGLYVVAKGRDELRRLTAGESVELILRDPTQAEDKPKRATKPPQTEATTTAQGELALEFAA